MTAVRVLITGRVQGVGFRFMTALTARRLGVTGSAVNLDDGSVQVEVYGEEDPVQQLIDWLRGPDTPGRVRRVEVSPLAEDSVPPPGFGVS